MPKTSFSTFTHVAGPPEEVVAFPLAARSTIVPTIERPASQPTAKAGPFAWARGVPSIRTIAMIGIGLMATPIAIGRVPPIAWPIVYLSPRRRPAGVGGLESRNAEMIPQEVLPADIIESVFRTAWRPASLSGRPA